MSFQSDRHVYERLLIHLNVPLTVLIERKMLTTVHLNTPNSHTKQYIDDFPSNNVQDTFPLRIRYYTKTAESMCIAMHWQ